ncbi:MAG: tryptophan--tRNA ligase [Deltaproteobacteria bacterium]|nr:tryptophan--tRNA ligase [Deltaproteobacteria bacterium]
MTHDIAQPRSLSGIKPTGQPHWGNYFGMIRPALELAADHDAMYFIADLHALTSVKDGAAVRRDSLDVAATLLACGLDPTRTILWRQSDVPEVLELTWVLSCATSLGLLERAHSVKDARAKGNDLNHGVYSYPVLMAADILLFDTDVVPVGRDQKQHLEMARDMATFVNVAWFGHPAGGTVDDTVPWDGQSLKRPRALVRDEVALVPGLDGQKMSKSYGNHIAVFADPKTLKSRIMAIQTDSTPLAEPKNPDTCHVVALYKLFATADELAQLRAHYIGGNYGYGHAKLALLAQAEAHFAPMRERYQAHLARPDDLEDLLRDGARRARTIAAPVLHRVRSAVGLPGQPHR